MTNDTLKKLQLSQKMKDVQSLDEFQAVCKEIEQTMRAERDEKIDQITKMQEEANELTEQLAETVHLQAELEEDIENHPEVKPVLDLLFSTVGTDGIAEFGNILGANK
ncbi:hypothetical protein LC065_20200 (plasmid) [Halobacillus litoralis]|uniref:hypothetical protein n=1 Tax=Halobacillus litoralis TaxID=45668 RepID=UPI001CFC8953|nr:hypothetical protein [Halobacillus litoralis]WLR49568.1 hypothetical protein LC065_20200 [Halobacillus litoralis]